MINPYLIIAFMLALAGSAFGGFWFGMDWKDKQYAESELARKSGWADALDATAKELAKLKVTNTTINNRVEKIVEQEKVYAECKNNPETVQLLNQAARGGK